MMRIEMTCRCNARLTLEATEVWETTGFAATMNKWKLEHGPCISFAMREYEVTGKAVPLPILRPPATETTE